MGTRNLTIVLKDNKHRIAQYCQWDGYPDGQGLIEEELDDVMRLAHEDADEEWDEESEFITFDVSRSIKSLYPHLQRDHGALILDTIMNATDSISLKDGMAFAADDLFCEYIWIVDFDKRVFQGLVPTKYLCYEAVENQESYLDTLDFDIKMTKVFERSLDDLPETEQEFIESFVRLE